MKIGLPYNPLIVPWRSYRLKPSDYHLNQQIHPLDTHYLDTRTDRSSWFSSSCLPDPVWLPSWSDLRAEPAGLIIPENVLSTRITFNFPFSFGTLLGFCLAVLPVCKLPDPWVNLYPLFLAKPPDFLSSLHIAHWVFVKLNIVLVT